MLKLSYDIFWTKIKKSGYNVTKVFKKAMLNGIVWQQKNVLESILFNYVVFSSSLLSSDCSGCTSFVQSSKLIVHLPALWNNDEPAP